MKNKKQRYKQWLISIAASLLVSSPAIAGPLEDLLGIPTPDPEAGFEMNFMSHSQSSSRTGGGYFTTYARQHEWSPEASAMVVDGEYGQTPFLTEDSWHTLWSTPELVTIGNTDYWHVLFGSIEDGFIQETYIAAGYDMDMQSRPYGKMYSFGSELSPPHMPNFNWGINSGSNWSCHETDSCVYNWGSASGGDYLVTLARPFGPSIGYDSGVGEANYVGNAIDPLGSYEKAGNGSADPRRVIVRQLLFDDEMVQQFLKNSFSTKPIVTQNIITPEIEMYTHIDMSHMNYSAYGAGPNSDTSHNTLILIDSGLPDPDWDMFKDSQEGKMRFNAGQFVYTPFSSNITSAVVDSDGDGVADIADSTYSYLDGGFDHKNVDWEAYIHWEDPTNVWSYPDGPTFPRP